MIENFPGKRPDEHVLKVIRHHWIVYVRIAFFFLIIFLIPVGLFYWYWSSTHPINSLNLRGLWGYLILIFYMLYGLAFFLIKWIDEEFDLFILTNHRLIDITQVSFFKRTVTATPLTQIQDINGKVQGLFGTLLNYGYINVRTAAAVTTDFEISHVHDPDILARKILNYSHQSKKANAVLYGGRDEASKLNSIQVD